MNRKENISYLLGVAGKEKQVLLGNRAYGAVLRNEKTQIYERYRYTNGGIWRNEHGNTIKDSEVVLEWRDPMTVCAMVFLSKRDCKME